MTTEMELRLLLILVLLVPVVAGVLLLWLDQNWAATAAQLEKQLEEHHQAVRIAGWSPGTVQDWPGVVRAILEDRHEYMVERIRLLELIEKHRNARGHERCWENDIELYRTAGLDIPERENPPVEQHRLNCDLYRAGLYGLPVEGEPCAQLRALQQAIAMDRSVGCNDDERRED